MKKEFKYITDISIAFTNLYSVLDELSRDEHSVEGARAEQFKNYMKLSCEHLTDKSFLYEFIKNDIWRN